MSRIGKIPVSVPKEVKARVDGQNIHLEGAKGKLTLNVPQGLGIELKDDKLSLTRLMDTKQHRSNHGTARANLSQMIVGLTQGHKRELEIQGIGFRAALQGKKIVFNLGLSHPVEFDVPGDLKISVPTQTSIIIEGVDIRRVGETAAKLRALKPVEPYKGKGIRYVGEIVKRKQGKSVTK